MNQKFVAYYRLSKESRSGGLGLDAQKKAVLGFLANVQGEVIQEFTEIESGKRTDRAELSAAIALCRKQKARLCIAKLDRLARNAAFLLTLRDSGVDFVAADLPHADRLTVSIMAVFAEHERDMISLRTKEALKAAKIRGTRLGNPNPTKALEQGRAMLSANAERFASNILPVIDQIQNSGTSSLRGIADALNNRGFKSPRGKRFSPQAVLNLLNRPKQAA